ncbi:MAG: cytochrome C, partial [Planctomycetota bacterium]
MWFSTETAPYDGSVTMFQKSALWLTPLIAAVLIGIAGGALYVTRPPREVPADDPWARMPPPKPHTDHSKLISGELKTGPDVTRKCLECHPDAAKEVMKTEHWTWLGDEAVLPDGRVVQIGKRNVINNFCIHALPNIGECSSCHAGYGWEDEHYTFDEETNVDCLVCHDHSNTYAKGEAGHPLPDVDLVAAAKSVGSPTRVNCGGCHFSGAGGDGVKHGDLDSSLYHPTERIDVHMGRLDFACVTCHRTEHHQIAGCSMSVSTGKRPRVECTDCHAERPHNDDRLDGHTRSVACQTCHIPRMAIDVPTQMYWD